MRTDGLRLRRWLAGWLIGWLALLLSGPLAAQTIESVLAPGPVIQGHAKVEHDCKSCHERFDRAAQDGLCNACHKDVGEDIHKRTGLHGKRDGKQACRACHTEHRGRGAQLAQFDTKTFDHKVTDFELHDKHVSLACAKCHVAGKRWREAPQTCVGCHLKDDVHKAGLGRKCDDCHSARAWKLPDYDHGKKTRFALTGKHQDAKCDDCHANGRYKDTPRTCLGCHKKEDDKSHKGLYGEKCESCHGTKAWKPPSFNHDNDTRYPLKDKHRAVKCSACHSGQLFHNKPGTGCVDCHAKDDKHKETLGKQCANCHSERGWKEPAGFDHAKSRFPLEGAHEKTKCKDCHTNALYRDTPSQCIECHKKNDKHLGNLGTDCKACHGQADWKNTQGRFDHDKTKFPLRNAHAARTVKCRDCHETLTAFRKTATECVACHQRDDRHEGTLGKKCEQCHRDVNWRVPRFDHSRTRYPLLGRHAVVACNACHTSLRYKEAKSECIACHTKADKHKGALGTACANCHNVRAWSLWDFNHDRSTHYPLEGAHKRARCETCHLLPAPAGKAIAPVSSDCAVCHRKQDVHEGRFGRRCEQCHVPESWHLVRQATAPKAATGGASGPR
jgi:hypothetical protein